MDGVLITVRAVHFGACVLLAGEFAFALLVAGHERLERVPRLARRQRGLALYAWLVAVASGALWLVLEAANMSGETLARAVAEGAVRVVLDRTSFGHVFALRALVSLALVGVLAWLALARGERARHALRLVALLLGIVLLVTLAFVGHAAAAGHGAIHVVHSAADMLHLLAAGGWLGALPALTFCLAQPLPVAELGRLTLRFSTLGIVCVVVLAASGSVNALFLVGSFAALTGTPYGRVLLVKLGVFAVMLGLAAINKQRLTPRLVGGDVAAATTLRRRARMESALGVAVIALVGALGVMVPANHALHAGHGVMGPADHPPHPAHGG
ncbi:MAG TPA: copper homeostasis membrane protein CopD [Casimicrobiaceae bacterium]|nr:copper homeostasis membrane protein CopD [Casimicrobiaceae bacterium]